MLQVDVQTAGEYAASVVGVGTARWRHVQTAAAAAAEPAGLLDRDEGDLLIAAAWLHDVGYDHPQPPTGFHPLDGAVLLLDAGWPMRLASLVAHHSEARFMAAARGLLTRLDEFPREQGPVSDGLTFADMTSAPDGRRVTILERLPDIRRRHAGEALLWARVRDQREPHLLLAAARVDVRLDGTHAPGHRALPLMPRLEHIAADTVAEVADRHPDRPLLDVEAAVRASASLNSAVPDASFGHVIEDACRLLLATADHPPEDLLAQTAP